VDIVGARKHFTLGKDLLCHRDHREDKFLNLLLKPLCGWLYLYKELISKYPLLRLP
jgi:hypothetical protein